MTACPSCGEEPSALFLTAHAIEDELAARERFFPRGRDLTDVVLGRPADVLRCERCGILIRGGAPDDDAFRHDRYNTALLRALHESHAVAFRAKRDDYRPLLPPDARVVEVGSYAGGFLRAATDWGWQPAGVDIGRDTCRFTAALGFDMRDAFDLPSQSIDGLFVWNCFEQLSDPRALLAAAHHALRAGGLLVIRVPDADLYAARADLRAIADNGLLGWPHRFGFGVRALRRLARQYRFRLQRVLRRPPLPPLFAAHPGWIELALRKTSPFAARLTQFAAHPSHSAAA